MSDKTKTEAPATHVTSNTEWHLDPVKTTEKGRPHYVAKPRAVAPSGPNRPISLHDISALVDSVYG